MIGVVFVTRAYGLGEPIDAAGFKVDKSVYSQRLAPWLSAVYLGEELVMAVSSLIWLW